MNLLGEHKLQTSSGELTLKLTMKSLYQTQVECGFKGLLELIQALDSLDLRVVYTLASKSVQGASITADELLEEEFDLPELCTFLAEQVAALFESGKKKKPSKKKK